MTNNTGTLIQRLQIGSSIASAPFVWTDHKGKHYRLHEMETSHLVNILRLIVNEWVGRHGLEPVPIRNPQAVLNLAKYSLEQFSSVAKMFAEAVINRLANGEQLSPGYQVVWDRVVAKILECLNCGALMLTEGKKRLAIPDEDDNESFDADGSLAH